MAKPKVYDPIKPGDRFCRLTVISADEPYISPGGESKFRRWKCLCDCGVYISVIQYSLHSGNTKSCGCKSKDHLATKINLRHGKTKSKVWNAWVSMRGRCYNKKNPRYSYYGGRGITVCQRWIESFENFYEDMGEPPAGYSLERKDNNGPYSPSNCEWATKAQQARNRRVSFLIEAFGEKKTCAAWEEDTRCAVFEKALYARMRRGWPPEKAITAPLWTRKK